jgi:hypothetical protein
VLVEVVLLSVLPVPFFFDFFLCTFVAVVEELVEDVLVFWTFLAAGAATRNGTATAVNSVLIANFFIWYFSFNLVADVF